jgi:hypothetical protein
VGSKSKDASENGPMMGNVVWRDIWLVLDGRGTMYALRYLTGNLNILLSHFA